MILQGVGEHSKLLFSIQPSLLSTRQEEGSAGDQGMMTADDSNPLEPETSTRGAAKHFQPQREGAKEQRH